MLLHVIKFFFSMISEPLSPVPLLVCSVIFVTCSISTILTTVLYKPWTMKMATPPPPLTTMVTGKPPVHTVISVKVSVYFNYFFIITSLIIIIIIIVISYHSNHHSSSYLITKLDIQPRYPMLMLKQQL